MPHPVVGDVIGFALRPRTVVPVRYEGRNDFREGVERAFDAGPELRETVRWLPIGEPVDLG